MFQTNILIELHFHSSIPIYKYEINVYTLVMTEIKGGDTI